MPHTALLAKPGDNCLMALRSVKLPFDVQGTLWLGSMPARFESWISFTARAQRAGLDLLVCLTPRAEMAELSPAYDAAVDQGVAGMDWIELPMRNLGLPEDAAAFRHGIQQIANQLRQGSCVMLHCAAGIGRTGTAAACVLKSLGLDAVQALQRVRDAGSNPQNAQQSGLVDWF